MWYFFGMLVALIIFSGLFSIQQVQVSMYQQNEGLTPGKLTIVIIIMSLIWPITLGMMLFDLTKPKG